jgi:hypothetical protein
VPHDRDPIAVSRRDCGIEHDPDDRLRGRRALVVAACRVESHPLPTITAATVNAAKQMRFINGP